MGSSLLAEIWNSVVNSAGWLIGVFGIALAMTLWMVSPEKDVSLRYAAPVVTLLIFLVLVFFNAVSVLHRKETGLVPKVISIKTEENNSGEVKKTILLCKGGELLSQGSILSIFYLDQEDYELFVGIGRVINIQTNNIIQVELFAAKAEAQDVVKKLHSQEHSTIKRILLKSTVPWDYVDLQVGGE